MEIVPWAGSWRATAVSLFYLVGVNMKKILAVIVLGLGLAAAVAWPQGGPPLSNQTITSPLPNLVFVPMTFTATGQTKSMPIGGISIATVRIAGPATAATLQIKASNDAGANYFAIPFVPGAGTMYTSGVLNVSNPGTFPAYAGSAVLYYVNLSGFNFVEVVSSGTFTGTSVSVQIVGSSNSGSGLI